VLGLLGCSVSLLVIAVSPGVGGAAVGAALLGLAFEIYEPPSQALPAEMVAPERRPQAFGLLGAALAAAGVGAGIIAVLLGGVSLRLLFVADSVTCVAAAALILTWVHEPSIARRATSDGNPWRDRRLLVMLGIGTGVAFAWNLSVTALPLTVAARGLGPAETGWPLAVAAVVTIVGQRSLRGAGPGFPPRTSVRRCSRSRGRRLPRGVPGGVRHLLGHRPDPWALASTRLIAIGVPVTWLTGAALCVVLAAVVPFAGKAVTMAEHCSAREAAAA
jgi:MFS family permease